MSSWCQDYRVTSNYLYIYIDIYIYIVYANSYIYIAQTAPDGPCYASCPSPFTVSTPPRAGRSPLWWGWSGRARLPCGGQLMMTSSGVCPCEFCGGNMPPEIFELNTLWWVNGYNLYIYIYSWSAMLGIESWCREFNLMCFMYFHVHLLQYMLGQEVPLVD